MFIITNPLNLAKCVLEEYSNCYGDHLISFIVYGSATGADFDPRSSDINLLIVLDSVTPEALNNSRSIQAKWIKKRIPRPLFMDKEYISSSLDSFPVEFLNLKENYKVMYGEDVLKFLRIRTKDVRLQVERELKGKWLHLMQEWLDVNKNPKLFSELLRVSMKDFLAAFRGLLYMKLQPIPKDRISLLNAVIATYGLRENYFERVIAACRSRDLREMNKVFSDYSNAIKSLTFLIDQQKEKAV